jgi:hypothetical protein
MAVERRNPVPPGTYWVDQFDQAGGKRGTGILGFDAWLKRNDDKVKLLKREEFPSAVLPEFTNLVFNDNATAGPRRVWYLFKVEQPVPWEIGWGFPTIATTGTTPNALPSVTTSDDTVTKPKVPTFTENLEEIFSDVKTVAVVAFLGWLWLQQPPGRRRR